MKYYVHEKAICESTKIGEATRIWAFTHVLPGAKIGSRCNLGEHVFVENNVTVGDGCTIKNGVALWDGVTLENEVFVGPCAVFTNVLHPRAFLKTGDRYYRPTVVKTGASIGANATLLCGVTVGEYALIGAGAVVLRDVPAHGLVVGNPGRVIGLVCFCGRRLIHHEYCEKCERNLANNSAEQAAEVLK